MECQTLLMPRHRFPSRKFYPQARHRHPGWTAAGENWGGAPGWTLGLNRRPSKETLGAVVGKIETKIR